MFYSAYCCYNIVCILNYLLIITKNITQAVNFSFQKICTKMKIHFNIFLKMKPQNWMLTKSFFFLLEPNMTVSFYILMDKITAAFLK